MKILFTDEVVAKFTWTEQKEKKEKFETKFHVKNKIIIRCFGQDFRMRPIEFD